MQFVDLDAKRPAHVLGNEGADALADQNQAVSAQAGNRLAHHGAAHAGCDHHFFLGRQPRTRRQAARGNVGGDLRHQLMGQPARRRQRAEGRKILQRVFGRQS